MKYIDLNISNKICILKINRPEALNALNSELLQELEQTIDELLTNDEVRFVLITGEGKSFVAGADISEMCSMTQEQAYTYSKQGNRVFEKIENMPKVVIGVVNGFALGGGLELALACDIRVASTKAKFGAPEVSLGIMPGFGGTQRLSKIVGLAKAKELIFTGEYLNSEQALQLGIISYIDENPIEVATNLIEKMKKNSFEAIIKAKESINVSHNEMLNLDFEAKTFASSFGDCDQLEGMKAFLDKAIPNFK